jgi:catechol 2,3-dioxygenase-like lactoylglutathione lyase family enzyme
MMRGHATVLTVRDLPAARAFYTERLGFAVTFDWPGYLCLCRDEVPLHLAAAAQSDAAPGQGALCVFVADVDALHAEFAARGVVLPQAPTDRAYGMRDFTLRDADGNQITFGMATPATA